MRERERGIQREEGDEDKEKRNRKKRGLGEKRQSEKDG